MQNSPYTPGAGHMPRVLAGRGALLQTWHLVLNDVSASGRVRAQDIILAGPRGVGKTVVLTTFADLARTQGFEVVNLQAVSGHVGLVEALLQRAKNRLEDGAGPWERARRAFERIGGVNLTVAGFGGGITTHPADRPGNIDAGMLAAALSDLADEIRTDQPRGGVLITVDELQVAAAPDLALLAATLHRLNVDHPQAVVLFAGTGLPFTPEVLRRAGVTHPDRLFALEPIPLTLEPQDALYAVVEAARLVGGQWMPEAAQAVVAASNGYPAHLQLFADAAWRQAPGPTTITEQDVDQALREAAGRLEQRTLGPRWERASDRQMEFLAALSVNGGQTSMSRVAATLGRSLQELSWLREELLEEGDIYAPKRGQIALTVPVFAPYVLAQYEIARADAAIELLSLEQMAGNAGLDSSTATLRSITGGGPASPSSVT